MSHPGSELAPYRESDETPLEALVRRGPAPQVRAQPWLGSMVKGIAAYLLLNVAVVAALIVWPLVPLVAVLLIRRYNRGLRRRHAQAAASVQAYAAVAPIAVEDVDRWCVTKGSLAAVELVFEPLSPLAERAVQVTVPEARISREGDRMLVRWTLDMPLRTARLIHLIDTLAPHRRELRLARVVCR